MLAIYDRFLTESISSRAWTKQRRRKQAQFAHSLAELKLHMHCLKLYKTSFKHRISMPKRKNCICQALEFASRQNPKKIASRRSAETELQNTIELRTTASEIVAPKPSRAAKDNSITNAATARSNLDTAITMWSAETELQNTTELRTTASEIVAPKPVLDARTKKRRFWSTF